jgi:hypothetical protein
MLLLIPLGFLTGAYGSLVGVGGGFILVPVLLMLHAGKNPAVVTSISLAVVSVNALSGSLAYAGMKRIDYARGILFALATVPGAILGALTTVAVPRTLFELLFGSFMLIGSVFLFVKPARSAGSNKKQDEPGGATTQEPIMTTLPHLPLFSSRLLIGVVGSLGIGFLASFLGIGGGIFHVPMMVYVLSFPVHIATATSQFILAITSLVGTGTHLATGALVEGWQQAILLAIGVIFGAQAGAQLSRHMHGSWIVRGLALALGITGGKFVVSAFGFG